MREPIRDHERLRHILNAISREEEFTQGLDKDTLNADILHLHATVYNIQIVGEACINSVWSSRKSILKLLGEL